MKALDSCVINFACIKKAKQSLKIDIDDKFFAKFNFFDLPLPGRMISDKKLFILVFNFGERGWGWTTDLNINECFDLKTRKHFG